MVTCRIHGNPRIVTVFVSDGSSAPEVASLRNRQSTIDYCFGAWRDVQHCGICLVISLPRPRTVVPENVRVQMRQLRDQGDSYQTISRKTGIKYNVVYREIGHTPRPMARGAEASPTQFAALRSANSSSSLDEEIKRFEGIREKSQNRERFKRPLEQTRPDSGEKFWQNKLREERALQEFKKISSPEFANNEQLKVQIEGCKLQTELSNLEDQFRGSTKGRAIFGDTRKLYVWNERYCLKILAEFVMYAMAGRGWSVDQTFTFIDRNFYHFRARDQ
ncbi:MAG: hypothetical protein AUJ07_04115 [Crenarchaeota archaeon 13_1_40CM_3_53_5]|nr:MAG: hypothetical protein AUJ07_04115 [Crenarchaeota archaeon 13_1_40CM_3_53_5]